MDWKSSRIWEKTIEITENWLRRFRMEGGAKKTPSLWTWFYWIDFRCFKNGGTRVSTDQQMWVHPNETWVPTSSLLRGNLCKFSSKMADHPWNHWFNHLWYDFQITFEMNFVKLGMCWSSCRAHMWQQNAHTENTRDMFRTILLAYPFAAFVCQPFPTDAGCKVNRLGADALGLSATQACLGANVPSGLVTSTFSKIVLGPSRSFVWGEGGASGTVPLRNLRVTSHVLRQHVPLEWFQVRFFWISFGHSEGAWGEEKGARRVRYLHKTQRSLHGRLVWEMLIFLELTTTPFTLPSQPMPSQ